MIGIIGGTALGHALGAIDGERVTVQTPFGPPSSPVTVTEVRGVKVALLARHGIGHLVPPSSVNYRANIWALKQLGVTRVLATTAVGSLREEIAPGHLVIPDQVIDKTFRRVGTFFDDLAVHVELAAPFCPALRETLISVGAGLPVTVHASGTYVVMEGPAFSTRAESDLHRGFGAHLIGMTVMPEAKLAREAELCYAAISLPTDYDCWRAHREDLSRAELLAEIRGNLQKATSNAMSLIQAALPRVVSSTSSGCGCAQALDNAIFSELDAASADVKSRLALLLERALQARASAS